MEDLTPAEKARMRLQQFRQSQGQSDEDSGGSTDTVETDSLSARERALQRLQAHRESSDTFPKTEQIDTVFDEEGESAGDGKAGGVPTIGAPGGGGFSAVDPDEQAGRMQALGKLYENRRQKPEQIEGELDTSSTDEQDPGIGPGDQSEAEREEKESALRRAAELAITTGSAVMGVGEDAERFASNFWDGLQKSWEQMTLSKSAQTLLKSPDQFQTMKPVSPIPGLVESGAEAAGIDTESGVGQFLFGSGRQLPQEEVEQIRMKAAEQYAESTEKLAQMDTPKEVQEAAKADGFFSAIKEAGSSPTEAIPFLVGSSALQSTPSVIGALLGAPAGPAGAAGGQFLGTMGVERRAAMGNLLKEEGVDPTNPNDLLAATVDPKKRRQIRNRASRRGVAVGGVDALFGAMTAGLSKLGLSPVTKSVGGFLLESAGEGTSELAGQAAAGEEINPAEAGLETVAAMGQSGATSLGTVAINELTPSETRLEQELRRQIEEGEASLEVPDSKISQLMQRAVDKGGLEQPQSAAEQTLNEAINRGEIEVEPAPEPTTETDEETEGTTAEGDREGGRPDGEGRPTETERSEEDRGGADRGTEEGAEATTDDTDPTRPGGMRARREPSTPKQRLSALGLEEFTTLQNRDDVADLETAARNADEMDSSQLNEQIENLRTRLEDLGRPPEERETNAVEQGLDPRKAQAMIQVLEQAQVEQEAERTGENEPEAEPEAAPEPGEDPQQFIEDLQGAEADLIQATAENEELQAGQVDAIRTEVERRLQENAIDESEAEAVLASLPEEDRAEGQPEESADEQADAEQAVELADDRAPDFDEVQEGATFVDVGGTEAREVEIIGQPTVRTVPVRKEAEGGTIETQSLLQNLRRPGDVEAEPPTSSFPEAGVTEGGTADLTEEWQVVPEGATIPEGADVRHDLGQSDLPVARMQEETETSQQEPERLDEMGRRTPIQQEERIDEQIEATERELKQAKERLQDLKRQKPEQQRQQGQQAGMFGGQQSGQQTGGEQQALGQQFEGAAQTTEELQQMIDDQRAYVNRLQDELVDLRKRAPDAKTEARRSQVDIQDQIEREQEPDAPDPPASEDAAPPREAADLSEADNAELSPAEFRDRRAAAIKEDLLTVLRDQWRNSDLVQENVGEMARTIDRIRELRESDQRGLVSSSLVEDNVAEMRDDVDQLLREFEADLASEEAGALLQRIRQWTGRTSDPGPPSTLHLNQITGDRQAGPQYETEDGYEVRPDGNGGLEIISPNTGNAIDRRSSRYDDVLIEYLRENSEELDQQPRVTDKNGDVMMGEWASAVASSSRNPFEIIEAAVVESGRGEAFDPVAMELEGIRFLTSSLEPYVSPDELIKRGAGAWVTSDEERGRSIDEFTQALQMNWGIEKTPDEIVHQYILEHSSPNNINDVDLTPWLRQFENVTGLPISEDLVQKIHEELYETRTEQTETDQGPEAPFEPSVPYVARPTTRRSNLVEQDGAGYRRRRDDRSLEGIVRDGYDVRESESADEARALGVQVMEQLSLFGPPNGTTDGESSMQAERTEKADRADPRPDETEDPPAIETTDDPSDLARPTEEELQRVQEWTLARGITDDLADGHGASLIGRTVTGPDDLAALAQVYRDPRFETMRYFFVRDTDDGEQEIVHQTGVSSRLPGASTGFPVELEGTAYLPEGVDPDNLSKWDKMHYWMTAKMDEVGADGFYMLHNHPTGRTTPSKADMRLTARQTLETGGFQGHIIIDSGEYRVLDVGTEAGPSLEQRRAEYREVAENFDPDDRMRQATRRDLLKEVFVQDFKRTIDDPEVLRRAQFEETEGTAQEAAPEGVDLDLEGKRELSERFVDRLQQTSVEMVQGLGRKIQGDKDLQWVAQDIQTETENPIMVLTGANGKVRGIMEVERDFLEGSSNQQIQRQVLTAARHHGSTRAFLTNVDDRILPVIQRLTSRGVFTDFVTQGGKGSAAYGIRVSREERRNQFGFETDNIDPVRVEEDQDSYGDQLRDEIRRRVGRLQHNRPPQQDPHESSGPADGEHVRQAAIRVGDQLYRGATHPEAVQAAINDGALTEEGGSVQMPGGRSLAEAEEAGDVALGLYTTSKGRVVARQETGHVLGVDRADMLDIQRRPQRRRSLSPPPNPRLVAAQLTELQSRGARLEATESGATDNTNAVDVTLESVSDEEQSRIESRRSLTDKTVNRDNPVSSTDVIRSFLDVVRTAGREVPLRYGRYRGFSFSTSGVFKVQEEVIRLNEANDIPTAAHEVAHALEKAVFGWVDGSPWQKGVAGTDGQVQEELVQLGKDLYGDKSPKGGYKREGFAEFMKFYLTDQREHLQDRSPAMLEWFENTFMEEHPNIGSAIEQAQDRGRRWYDQGALKRGQEQIVRDRTFWENFKTTVRTEAGRERLKTQASKQMLTEFSPLLRVVEEAEERMGEELPIEQNPFETAEALGKTHTARTRMFVEQGTFDFAGNPKGPPLRDAAQMVGEENREEFTLYLWARRALKLWEGREAKYDDEGNLIQTEKEPRDPGLSKEDAEYIFDYYDSETFRQAAERVYQWNNDVLDYTKAAFDPQLAENVKGGDVGDYVPLQRVFGELNQQVVEARQSATGGSVLGSDPINALEGSSRRIRDPFQTMIEQAEQFIRATHERFILNQLITLGENVEGMGRYVEQVPRKTVANRVSIDRIISDLQDEGISLDLPRQELREKIDQIQTAVEDGRRTDLSGREEIEEAARGELIQEKLGGFLSFYKPAVVPEGGGDPIVSVHDPESGDVKWYEVSRELYDTLQGLDVYRLPKYLDWIFGTTARTFRLGTTGIRASFALITNPARDLQVLAAQSKAKPSNSGSLFANYLQSMRNSIQSTIEDDVDVDPSLARFMRLGGQMARPLGVDTQQTKRAAREVFQDRKTRLLTPTNWFDHIRDVFQIPESATRVAEFKTRAEEIGWQEGTKMDEGQALQLLLDAKRVTTDFTSQGQATKVLNQMIPFVTATIGGQRAFARAWKRVKEGNPRALIAATTLLTATGGYWWQRKDEEWYKDLEAREKLNNWFFPVGEDGPVFVLPRPFEWGATFSAIPEALLDGWYQGDPEAVDDAIGHLYKNWSPLGVTETPIGDMPIGFPVPIQVGFEQAANKKFYFDSPIVPRGEQRKPVVEQYGPYTSTVAIQVGRIFNVSPRRIDHLIAGFFGGVGRDATQSLDGLLSTLGIEGASPNVEREQTEADIPVIGELFRPGRTARTGESVNEFFDLLEEKQKIQASDVKEETMKDRQTRLMLQDAQKALSLLFWLRRNTKPAEQRRELSREIRRLAKDATTTARGDLTGVLEKRGELGPMKNLERNQEQIDTELLRDMVERVNPTAIQDTTGQRATDGQPAEEADDGSNSPTP